MKKTTLLILVGLMSVIFGQQVIASDKKYRVAVGSIPGASGFEDAFLTDRVVSGEGSTSEQVFMNYTDSNSSMINPAVSIAIPVKINGQTLSSYVENSEAFGELTFSYSDALSLLLNAKVDYTYYRPSSSLSFTFSPAIGGAILSQDMGVVSVFPGQINTVDGDFNPGESINMTMMGAVMGFSTGVNYDANQFSLFANIGFQYAMLSEPEVTINDTKLSGQIHANNCTGTSSVDLECTDYFNPFESAGGLTGLTFQLGATF